MCCCVCDFYSSRFNAAAAAADKVCIKNTSPLLSLLAFGLHGDSVLGAPLTSWPPAGLLSSQTEMCFHGLMIKVCGVAPSVSISDDSEQI